MCMLPSMVYNSKCSPYNSLFLRDLRESRNRCDSALHELHHKENEIRDIQKSLETSEGCKYNKISIICS